MNPKVNFYFTKPSTWQKEIAHLRTLILETGLQEDLKWGVPCYLFQNKNIVLIHVFKEYCALLFFKGALMSDTEGILIQQTKNTQATRQIRFTQVKDIIKMSKLIKRYVYEAIEIEKAGLTVELKKTEEFDMPSEFEEKLKKNKSLKTAFYALSPGRQRAYLLFFAAAKQTKTREARIEKYTPAILNGKGLND